MLNLWDFTAGQSFSSSIDDALREFDVVLWLFSAAHVDWLGYEAEQWSALLTATGVNRGQLVLVRVEDVPVTGMPAMLRSMVLRDVFGMPEDRARQVLLEALHGHRHLGPPPALAGSPPRWPGARLRLWNVPARNSAFTGRDGLLAAIREKLISKTGPVVQAVQGMGGFGKTQLALEYAHRFASSYDLVWWVTADHAAVISEQFADLGTELGLVEHRAGTEAARSAVLRALRDRDRWLLVFDNASKPGDLERWIPDGGDGHVLITSRADGWDHVAVRTAVGVFDRAEAVAMLQSRVTGLSEADASQLAGRLGDLPMALAQAAGFMTMTDMTAARYLAVHRAQATQIVDFPGIAPYPPSLAAVTRLTAARLADHEQAAYDLAVLWAFLAPEPIPADLITFAAGARSGRAIADDVAVLAGYEMVQAVQQVGYVPGLVQAILRDHLTPDQATAARARAEQILIVFNPGDPVDTATWPGWRRLIPHVLAADLAATTSPGLRMMACDAIWYLLARDVDGSEDLASDLYQQWRKRLGADHQDTLAIGHCLAWVLHVKGQHIDARDLNADLLARKQRVLGADHLSTLATASALASNQQALGDCRAAQDLNPVAFARDFGIDVRELAGTDGDT